jgi:hypothetical protein
MVADKPIQQWPSRAERSLQRGEASSRGSAASSVTNSVKEPVGPIDNVYSVNGKGNMEGTANKMLASIVKRILASYTVIVKACMTAT